MLRFFDGVHRSVNILFLDLFEYSRHYLLQTNLVVEFVPDNAHLGPRGLMINRLMTVRQQCAYCYLRLFLLSEHGAFKLNIFQRFVCCGIQRALYRSDFRIASLFTVRVVSSLLPLLAFNRWRVSLRLVPTYFLFLLHWYNYWFQLGHMVGLLSYTTQ